jgi:hypothetical protein
MIDSTTPAPACTRPAAQDQHPPKASVALPLSTFGGHCPASTVHAHAGTAAMKSII